MLLRLCIKNYILIDKLELDFKKGLTVITGETGSGKSIIIDALMILFGAKIAKNITRDNTQKLTFEVEFKLNNNESINWLKNNDFIDVDDSSLLICKRVIDNENKSKIYINGYAATNLQIKQLGEMILDIYSQHSSITLLKNETQRKLLDTYAGINEDVIRLGCIYKNINIIQNKIAVIEKQIDETSHKKNSLLAILDEFNHLNIKEGEWLELNTRHKELLNSALIITELNNVSTLIQNSENSIIKQLNYVNKILSKLPLDKNKIDQLLDLVEGLSIDLKELDYLIESIAININQDEFELEKIENKISDIFDKSRKYKVDPEKLLEYISEIKLELTMLSESSDIGLLKNSLSSEFEKYFNLAKSISNNRNKFADKLSINITNILYKLAINGEFKVKVIQSDSPLNYGNENIEYMISYNKGIPLQPFAKVASGGELSRTALALYLLLSNQSPPDVIIFDEIDVGISGKVTSFIGEMLRMLGETKQIVCITHQPQTASYANNHLVVNKTNAENKTVTSINYVNGLQRVNEIARMLGGINITSTTLSHASEMLEVAKNTKNNFKEF